MINDDSTRVHVVIGDLSITCDDGREISRPWNSTECTKIQYSNGTENCYNNINDTSFSKFYDNRRILPSCHDRDDNIEEYVQISPAHLETDCNYSVETKIVNEVITKTKTVTCNITEWKNGKRDENESKCNQQKMFNHPAFNYQFYDQNSSSWKECEEKEYDKIIKCQLETEQECLIVKQNKTHNSLHGIQCQESAFFLVTNYLPEHPEPEQSKIDPNSVSLSAGAIAVPFVVVAIIAFILVCSIKLKRSRNQQEMHENENIKKGEHFISFRKGRPKSNGTVITNITDAHYKRNSGNSEDLNLHLPQQLSRRELIDQLLENGTFNPAYNLQTTDETSRDKPSVPRKLYYNKEYNRRRGSFNLGIQLGHGAFGEVYKGELKAGKSSSSVAIKTVKDILDTNTLSSFLDEMKIMSNLKHHPNLVNFVGACIEEIHEHELYIILEYCPFGDLNKFLFNKKVQFSNSLKNVPGYLDCEFNLKLLFQWSHSIAKGMEFLSEMNIMHGDLAARNILVGPNYTAKISDFGLAKHINYTRGKNHLKLSIYNYN